MLGTFLEIRVHELHGIVSGSVDTQEEDCADTGKEQHPLLHKGAAIDPLTQPHAVAAQVRIVPLVIDIREQHHARHTHDDHQTPAVEVLVRAVYLMVKGNRAPLHVRRHPLQHAHRRREALCHIENISDEHQYKRPQDLEQAIEPRAPSVPAQGRNAAGAPPRREQWLQQHGGEDDQAVPEAEGDVPPACAVPDADHEEHHNAGETGRQDLGCMASKVRVPEARPAQLLTGGGKEWRQGQRIENILLHPGAQRDVPAAPVIVDRGRQIRLAEVLRKADPQNLCNPSGNIDAARKIRIELQRIQKDRQHRHGAGILLIVAGHKVDVIHNPVGEDHLAQVPPQDQLEAVLAPAPVRAMPGE